MILVDSSVWIDYFRGANSPEANYLDSVLGKEPVSIGDLILAEVLQGTSSDQDFERVRRELANFDIVIIGGKAIAIQAARNYRALRAKGVTIRKTIDTMIATRCIEDDLPLLFSDRDFEPFVTFLGLRSALGEIPHR